MKRVLIMCIAMALLVPAALAQAQPNPDEVYVDSITSGGSGCPAGTVGHSFSSDRTSFTLIFDQFIASSGPGVPVTDARKNCQINVNLHVPQGFQFSIGSAEYRGFVQLPAGVSAEQNALYFFQGSSPQLSKTSRFVGPVSKDYLRRDTAPFSTVVWSECGAVVPLNINSQVRLIGPASSSAQITTDSIDGKVKTIFAFAWREC